MTIKELIEKLKAYPEELRILVDGYEGGFSEISAVNNIKIKLNANKESYYGPHEDSEDGDNEVVVIRRCQ